METTEQTFRQKVDRVLEMLKSDYDWEKHYEQSDDDLDDVFRQCAFAGLPESKEESKKYVECGSAETEDTPKALYRLLYLLKPKCVDFSGMYKSMLFGIFSADKRFLVAVHLYKYEVGLYFYCLRDAWQADEGAGFIVAGMPGADNGWRCTDEDGNAFFEMVKQAVNYTWQVYPGNNFEV